MSKQNLIDERHITNAIIFLEGKKLDFISLNLEQSFTQHHTFSLVMDFDKMKKEFINNPVEQLELIGKTIKIELQQGNDNANAYEFKGIITHVFEEDQEGKHGFLVIEGSDPSILLEGGKRIDIHSQTTLQEIFNELHSEIPTESLSCVNQPNYSGTIPFLMQYKESNWLFLQRLSLLFGETLFYSGMDLIFGSYSDWETTKLVYDRELTRIRFGSRFRAPEPSISQYLVGDDIFLNQKILSRNHSNEWLNEILEKNKNLNKLQITKTFSEAVVEDQASLDEIGKQQEDSNATQTAYIEGESKTCDPRIGRLITILMPENISEKKNLGTYRIVKVKHTIDQNHRYHCHFEAIPASLKQVPIPNFQFPILNSMMALVTDNNDPENNGRVQVEFPFCSWKKCETWLRVMTPDAGSSNDAEKNRGIVFIPEKGDQVMIGFEMGDPNRPYVMGSLFHGKNSMGGSDDNHIKSIITRSGHTIKFDDSEDSCGIQIKDKNGNLIHLDTNGKSISIKAAENISLTAKNISLTASENLSASAEYNINIQANENINILAEKSHHLTAEESVTNIQETYLVEGKCLNLSGEEIRMDSREKDMDLRSGKKVNVQSSEKVNLL